MSPEVYIGMGSNQGEKVSYLQCALGRMQDFGKIDRISSVYETEPWGKKDQPVFLNAVCAFIPTKNDPFAILDRLQDIEQEAGRGYHKVRWGPRKLDLDILFWGTEVIESEPLSVPHPFIADRKFVLVPLMEIAPDLIHPTFGISIKDLLEICSDKSIVSKIGPLEIE